MNYELELAHAPMTRRLVHAPRTGKLAHLLLTGLPAQWFGKLAPAQAPGCSAHDAQTGGGPMPLTWVCWLPTTVWCCYVGTCYWEGERINYAFVCAFVDPRD